jgi:hypothetical protein
MFEYSIANVTNDVDTFFAEASKSNLRQRCNLSQQHMR